MLTESSNPTIAKKASVVAAITGQKKLVPLTDEKSKARETSPFPAPIASNPTMITIRSPDNSTQVSTTFSFTLSPTPRKLTAATRPINASATIVTVIPPLTSRSSTLAKLAAKAREAVADEVMPEHITAKATMKVRKWMPKARWV